MDSRTYLLRAYIRSAVYQAEKCGKTAVQLLSEVQGQRFTQEASEGRTIISTTEAGGTVTFAFPGNFSFSDVMQFTEEALEMLNGVTDTAALIASWTPLKKRVRFTFDMGAIS